MFQTADLPLIFEFLQSSDGKFDCDSRSGIVGPGIICVFMQEPQWQIPVLHLDLIGKRANVLSVPADFNFIHHLLEGGTVICLIFMQGSFLLGTFSHVTINQLSRQREVKVF